MNSKIIEKIKSDEILSKIIEKFDNEIFLVGGTVRDYYMGLKSTDRDIIVMDEDAKKFALKLSDLFDATFVPLDEENRIYRLVLPDKINYIAFLFLTSGAILNLSERIIYGNVDDFIKLPFINFPMFNYYDLMITFGVFLLIIKILKK